jgi:hypothetical protein
MLLILNQKGDGPANLHGDLTGHRVDIGGAAHPVGAE